MQNIVSKYRAYMLIFFTIGGVVMAGCQAGKGSAFVLPTLNDRESFTCDIAKAFYAYDFNKLRNMIYKNRDPDVFIISHIYALRDEMDHMKKILIKTYRFECDASYGFGGLVVATGAIDQLWRHGRGVVGFEWRITYSDDARALIQKFEWTEHIQDYKAIKRKVKPKIKNARKFDEFGFYNDKIDNPILPDLTEDKTYSKPLGLPKPDGARSAISSGEPTARKSSRKVPEEDIASMEYDEPEEAFDEFGFYKKPEGAPQLFLKEEENQKVGDNKSPDNFGFYENQPDKIERFE